MLEQECEKIIREYSPYKGFFDLSKKPEGINRMFYAKILRWQNFLVKKSLMKNSEKDKEILSKIYVELGTMIYWYWVNPVIAE